MRAFILYVCLFFSANMHSRAERLVDRAFCSLQKMKGAFRTPLLSTLVSITDAACTR